MKLNFKAVKSAIVRTAKKAGYQIKRHAPEILLCGAGAFAIGGAVVAAERTTKLEPIVDDIRVDISKLKGYKEIIDAEGSIKYDDGNGGEVGEYTLSDYRKDLVKVYVRAGWKLGKLYAPALGCEIAAITLGGISHNIMVGRESRALASCLAAEAAFDQYRKRIIEDHGEEYDNDVIHGVRRLEVEEPVIKKNGEIKTDKNGEVVTTKTKKIYGPILPSKNAFIFDERCKPFFVKGSYTTNEGTVKDVMNSLLYVLISDGYLFKNDIYKKFGIPFDKNERDIGLIYDPHDKTGAHSLSSQTVANPLNYRILNLRSDNLTEEQAKFFLENRDALIVDFDVDGNIIPYIDQVMYPSYPTED